MNALSGIFRSASRRSSHIRPSWPVTPKPIPRRTFTSNFHPRNQYVRFGDSNPNPQSRIDPRRHDTVIKVGVIGLGLCTAYYVAHLEQVPETGRWRFIDVGPELEKQLGLASRAQIHSEFRDKILPVNHPLTLHVQEIVQRILASSNLGVVKNPHTPVFLRPTQQQPSDDLWTSEDDAYGTTSADSTTQEKDRVPQREFEVIVIDDRKVVNAAATPGIVYVFTGMLPITHDDSGLAAVLSHEIGHVVARHIPERVSSQKVLFVIASLLEILGLDFGVSRILTTLALDLPNSRTQEKEADVIGLRLMAKACYDPSASPRVFSQLAKLENKSRSISLEFLQTHPLSENRVRYLEELLPEAQGIVAANPDCSIMRERLEAFRSAPVFRPIAQDVFLSG